MEKRDRSLYPLNKCGPISHSEDHLQVLTPNGDRLHILLWKNVINNYTL
jgi:hypothetical protein